MDDAERARRRIAEGLDPLVGDPSLFAAFVLANRAMALRHQAQVALSQVEIEGHTRRAAEGAGRVSQVYSTPPHTQQWGQGG